MITIWNSDSGDLITRLEAHWDDVGALAWSPDGRFLASGSHDQQIIVWDMETRKPIYYSSHYENIFDLAWSPTPESERPGWEHGFGVLAASGENAFSWTYSFGTGWNPLPDFKVSGGLVWTPDGPGQLAIGTMTGAVLTWMGQLDEKGGDDPLIEHSGNGQSDYDYVVHIDLLKNGEILASNLSDKGLTLWNVANSQDLTTINGFGDNLSGVSWSPDGTHIS